MWAGGVLVLAAIVGGSSCLAAGELKIVNSSGKPIEELYVAAAGERSWGADLLRAKQPRVIGRGETFTVADIPPGTYQVMLMVDGGECQIDAVDITADRRIDLTARALRECTSSH
jgi:hypothetical protein